MPDNGVDQAFGLCKQYNIIKKVRTLVSALSRYHFGDIRVEPAHESQIRAEIARLVIEARPSINKQTRALISKSFPPGKLKRALEGTGTLGRDPSVKDKPETERLRIHLLALLVQYPINWRDWHTILSSEFPSATTMSCTSTQLSGDIYSLFQLLDICKDVHCSLDPVAGRLPDFEPMLRLLEYCNQHSLRDEHAALRELYATISAPLDTESGLVSHSSVYVLLNAYVDESKKLSLERKHLEDAADEFWLFNVRKQRKHENSLLPGSIETLGLVDTICKSLVRTLPSDHDWFIGINRHGAISRLCLYVHAATLGCDRDLLNDWLNEECARANHPIAKKHTPMAWSFLLERMAFRAASEITLTTHKLTLYATVALLSKTTDRDYAEATLTDARKPIALDFWENKVRQGESGLMQSARTHRKMRKLDTLHPADTISPRRDFLARFPLREWMHGRNFINDLEQALILSSASELVRTFVYALYTPWSSVWHSSAAHRWFFNAPTKTQLDRLVSELTNELCRVAEDAAPFNELRRR